MEFSFDDRFSGDGFEESEEFRTGTSSAESDHSNDVFGEFDDDTPRYVTKLDEDIPHVEQSVEQPVEPPGPTGTANPTGAPPPTDNSEDEQQSQRERRNKIISDANALIARLKANGQLPIKTGGAANIHAVVEEIPPPGPTGTSNPTGAAEATGATITTGSSVSTGATGGTRQRGRRTRKPTVATGPTGVSTGATGVSTGVPTGVSTGTVVVTGTGLEEISNPPDDDGSIIENSGNGSNVGNPSNAPKVELGDILNQALKESGLDLEYSDVLGFIKAIDPSILKGLSSTKGKATEYRNDCDNFIKFLALAKDVNGQRTLNIIISEIVSYINENTDESVGVLGLITLCGELYNRYSDEQLTVPNGIGYSKIRIMVENAFIIEYLRGVGTLPDLKVGNNVDESLDTLIKDAVDAAYNQYVTEFGDIADKYILAYQRIQNDRPEMLSVTDKGDYEAFYKMLRTFCGASTVGIDLTDIDLNMESYSPGEAAALYAAVIAKMDELSQRYRKSYDNEAIERVVDKMASRGYRASQTNAIEFYCEELFNPKKEVKVPKEEEIVAPKEEMDEPQVDIPPLEKDKVSIDYGTAMATQAYIPAGYGLSKSHVEINKPYTEIFGIPYINIRHPIFKTIALKYSNRYSRKKAPKGKDGAIDKLFEKRIRSVEANAEKAERQLIKEIKKGSLMSRFLFGDTTKETQVKGEGLGLASSIEKGLRRVTSLVSNPILIKNILKLIKMAIDGDETPVSRNTLVVATDRMNAYDRNPIVSNVINDQFANVRVYNPVKPEKTAAVSKKYLKQFYDIVNPLENADEYIACGAFSGNLPNGLGGTGMFRAQMKTISSGAIDPSAVSDAAINAFHEDIMMHGGYPYTYVLTDQVTGSNNQTYRIARNNNFLGDLFRMDVDLVAIHVKKAGMDGIFILENHDAEVLFS